MKIIARFFLLFFLLISVRVARSQDFNTDFKQAIEYYNTGKYAEAAQLFEKEIPAAKESKGKNDTAVYKKLVAWAGSSYYNAGNYEQAEPLLKEALRIDKEILSGDQPEFAIDLNNLAALYEDMVRYEQAEPLYKEALRIDKEKLGGDHPSYVKDLNNLERLYREMGRYEEAELLMKEVLRIDKEKLGKDHPDYAMDLNNLALLYHDMGRYKEAEPFMKEALRIDKEKLSGDNPEYAIDLNNLALLYHEMGRYEQAEPLMKEVTKIFKDQLGENHLNYAVALNNLAGLYQTMGRYEQAEPLMKEVLRIRKEKLGGDHPEYAASLQSLSILYLKMGRYEQAEPLMKAALRIDKEKLGGDHPDYAIGLNNLALLYKTMGRYEQAEPLMKEAIRISQEKLGEDHPIYAVRLNNLAWLYQAMGRYEQAEPLLKEALRIDKEKLGGDHPSYALDLNNLALLYFVMGRYEEAELMMKEALRIDKEKLGEDHPSYARYLNNLALLYQTMGRYEKAEPLMQQALKIIKGKLGGDHPSYAGNLNNLAQLYQAMGRNEQAEPLMKEAFGIFQYQLKKNTGFLSEKELEEFLNTFLYNLEIYQSFNISEPVKDSMDNSGAFAFDIELNRKGILLQAAQQIKHRILESGDTSLVNSFNTLLTLRKQIEKLNSLDSAKRYDDPVKLEQQANELEKTITLKSQDYRQNKEEASITWKEVQQQLKPGEAVIEFSSFRFYDKRETDSIYYCALVLRPEYTVPKMVFLFEERSLSKLLNTTGKDIHRLYATNRGVSVIGSEGNDSSYQSGSLYRLIFKPIDSLLKGVKTIYYVPSGLLHKISFPAIAPDTKERLADKYNLTCLSSSKKLVTKQQEEQLFTGSSTVVLFGGINYEWNTSQPQRLQQTTGGDLLALRGTRLPEDKTRSGTFSYLPGTFEEVKSIDEQCRKHRVKVQLYTADMATEAQFKSFSGKNSPAIIHLSTHGFFIADTTKESRKNQTMNSNEQSYRYAKDPLLRSGLALAGANRAWSGQEIPEGMENGILQAKEVSNMDLRNTKLVVLSACETGLGDVKGSEGVFGLQRSFKMAGAEYLLMSLWSVPDEATQKLMTMFYENLFNGQLIREAFKNAQNKLRHLKKEYEDPFYWAAWVLVE